MDVSITDVPERRRYEARVDGQLAAIAEYLPADDTVVFTHTQAFDGYEGKGVASALIRSALDDVRRKQLSVLPVCPFVAQFVQRHPEDYADLIQDPSAGRSTPQADST
ncbi:N-acetyltransferase [Micromonospora sp. DR5-3]|uniref:GNAT family N-acetyltransferase n=1 Tax=unclassified Micromonospora TaxID=2617518 RepID=UPI0011D5E92B|nr:MULTISPECIES: GNAT family N-acetyltransferase [unclassified Micromonospora]MCW3818810.1 N-acetyltransferase [Micromonospora sp. DR5-3]TYC20472.1 N-acetyltransferase [Micromonospora sp. MP36]